MNPEPAHDREGSLPRAWGRRVYLQRAKLPTAHLEEAIFRAVDLRGANLINVVGLTESQLQTAITDWMTALPVYITLHRARARYTPEG